jgi:histidinol phosphatase-like PHP family hydrolase
MNEMIETAINLGFKEIAITDHYDPDYPDQEYLFSLLKFFSLELPLLYTSF